jgi:hypothetical protein
MLRLDDLCGYARRAKATPDQYYQNSEETKNRRPLCGRRSICGEAALDAPGDRHWQGLLFAGPPSPAGAGWSLVAPPEVVRSHEHRRLTALSRSDGEEGGSQLGRRGPWMTVEAAPTQWPGCRTRGRRKKSCRALGHVSDLSVETPPLFAWRKLATPSANSRPCAFAHRPPHHPTRAGKAQASPHRESSRQASPRPSPGARRLVASACPGPPARRWPRPSRLRNRLNTARSRASRHLPSDSSATRPFRGGHRRGSCKPR